MRKRIKGKKLGRKKAHREALIKNLLRSLFDHNYVVTTTAKAKVLKQEASSLIEKGKTKGKDLNFKRELSNILGKEELIKKYEEYLKKENIGVGFVRVSFRSGDNSEMSRVFLLGLDKKKTTLKKSKKEEKKEKEKKEKGEDVAQSPLDKREEQPAVLKKEVTKTAVIKKKRRARTRAGL